MDNSTVHNLVHAAFRARDKASRAICKSSCAAGLLLLVPLYIAGSSPFSHPASAQSATSDGSSRSAVEHQALLQEAEKLNAQVVQLYGQGKYVEAVALAEKVLSIRESVLGKEHPDVAASLNNLAFLYDNQGRYDQAEPLYKRSLAISEAALGKEHPDVATSLNNLAGLYNKQGHYDQAEPLYKRSLASSEAARGKEHPDVATSLNNL
ncbi:MAG: tetratricopeptide repeat-containing protein, partial [Gemmatimonadaceae bacterium]|nr:tetratricopeptide repeat-containing protein [Gloeobacterales cyanobacterium ES-bin-141]